jgi:hypothetical protein
MNKLSRFKLKEDQWDLLETIDVIALKQLFLAAKIYPAILIPSLVKAYISIG